MNKHNKLLYILSAVLGFSILTAGTVVAGYGNENNVPQNVRLNKDGSLFPGGICPNCSTDKDGSLFPGGPCVRCTKDGSLFPGTCKKCVERVKVKNYVPYNPVVAEAVERNCCQMAPITLSHVDFRIKDSELDSPYTNKLGNYRFRIFGCRRFDKEAVLNKGRIMEKNIAFNTVFEEVVGDCYKVLPMPQDLCLEEVPSELPEYVLTAEITDYFMNICDEYNWDEAKKEDIRSGSSEITITWRLMDLTKNKVYWKGESVGYGELYNGEINGEVKLIERAFADATSNLRNLPGFEDRLMQRISPTEMAMQRNALIEEERALNPLKCGFRKEYDQAKDCELGRPGADISKCRPCPPCVCPQTCEQAVQFTPIAETVPVTPVIPGPVTVFHEDGVCTCSCPPTTSAIPVVEIYEDGGVNGNGFSIKEEICNTIVSSGGTNADGIIITEEVCDNITNKGGVVADGIILTEETCDAIVAKGGVTADGITITEEVCDNILAKGGVVADGIILTKETCDAIVADGGVKADGITIEGGVNSDGIVINEEVCDVVLDSGGVISDGLVVSEGCDVIFEDGNVYSSFDIINSCIDENGNVKDDGMCQVVDDTWVETGDAKSLDNFCVVETDPCKALTPETIHRMRSSIVQITSPNGRKGAGLLISDRFVLTAGDLVDKENNSYDIKTIRNDELKARAVRINPSKNTALFMLDKSTEYTPLALNLSLPEVGKSGFLTVGLLDVSDFKNGEDYLENSARIEGYRYTEDKGAEILANTFIQNVTVGGALIYKDCTINGMAHSGTKTDDGLDMFIPTETALRSLGISICGHEYVEESPWQQTVYKPVTEQIKKIQKAPEAMKPEERK